MVSISDFESEDLGSSPNVPSKLFKTTWIYL